jgi:hypothetical protein
MPSVSAKQEKFMRAVANSPKFAKKVGVPQSVGKEFQMKDKEGKMMKAEGRGMAKANMQKVAGAAVKKHEDRMHAAKKGGMIGASKMGKVKSSPKRDGVATKGKTKGKMVAMQKGGYCK